MRTFQNTAKRNASLLLYVLITVVLYVPFTIFFEQHPAFTMPANVIYGLLALFIAFQMLFRKRVSSGFLRLVCTGIMAMATNRFDFYEKIMMVFPQIESVSKNVLILIAFFACLGFLILLFFKLFSYFDEDKALNENETPSMASPIDSTSSGASASSGQGNGGAQTPPAEPQLNARQPVGEWGAYAQDDFSSFLKLLLTFGFFALAIYLFRHYGLDSNFIDFDSLFSTLLNYASAFLLFYIAIMFVITIVGSVYQYFNYIWNTAKRNVRKDAEESAYPLPPYFLSIGLVYVLFYHLRNIELENGEKLTLDSLADMMVVGNYLAKPAAIVIIIALFFLLVQLTYTAVLMLMKITPQRIYAFIQKEEKRWGVIERMIDIVRIIIVDIILGALESFLKFIKFVPDFFDSLSDLVLYDEDEDDEKEDSVEEKNDADDSDADGNNGADTDAD